MKEVYGAVEKGEIETIDKFIKKYGINNIRLIVSKWVCMIVMY